MKKKNETMLTYEFYMMQWKKNKDPNDAVKIVELLENNLLGVSIKFDGELKFVEKSRFKNKCVCCGKYYASGQPCFLKDGKGWHVECGSETDKQNTFYLKWLESEEGKAYFAAKETE